jgi:hypothetical protein
VPGSGVFANNKPIVTFLVGSGSSLFNDSGTSTKNIEFGAPVTDCRANRGVYVYTYFLRKYSRKVCAIQANPAYAAMIEAAFGTDFDGRSDLGGPSRGMQNVESCANSSHKSHPWETAGRRISPVGLDVHEPALKKAGVRCYLGRARSGAAESHPAHSRPGSRARRPCARL